MDIKNQQRIQNQSKGRMFPQKFQKTTKFYQMVYHIQKSTYKGLHAFYKKYADVERQYAGSMIKLTKQFYSELPEITRENPINVSTLKEIVNCMEGISQLHYNFAQRMIQISDFYNSEYNNSKKKKDNHMKILKNRNEEQYHNIRSRENTPKNIINNKQKQIFKLLYDNLDKIVQQENQKMHKIKQQTIIYFSLYKKVCQKQFQLTSQHNVKLVKQQYQMKNQKIYSMEEQLRNTINQYGGSQLQKKNFTNPNSFIGFKRDSLKASMILKQRKSKIVQTQDKLKKMIQDYDTAADKLVIISVEDEYIGFFNTSIFGKEQRRKYARELNGKIIRNIIYDMLQGYSKYININSDQLILLQIIKISLKVKSDMPVLPNYNCSDLSKYMQQTRSQISDQQYLYHIGYLQQLSKPKFQNFTQLDKLITHRQKKQIKPSDIVVDLALEFIVKSCLLDILLDCLCVNKANSPVLVDGFVDYLHLIAKFGEEFFHVHRSVPILLLLHKINRYINYRDTKEQLQSILADSYFLQSRVSASKLKQRSEQQTKQIAKLSSQIVNTSTGKLCRFYQQKQSYLNNSKMLLIIDKMGYIQNSNFNAKDYFYNCIKCAGYNYLKSASNSHLFFDTTVNTAGEEKLKNIVQCIEELDYEGIAAEYFHSCSQEISKLLGVGDQIVRNKLFYEFTLPLYDIINSNLVLLSEQQGVDRDGYILRLGIILAKLDIQNSQYINQYDTFFKVLKSYLQSTQKDYDNMLEHSRKTQLWIIQQNSQATSNCIDFCSLLYKPFQFLLTSLKELQKSKKTQYTKKYSEFIKLRLNNILKNQIIKYVNFLYESLSTYKSNPPQISLKPRKLDKPNILIKQQMQKQRQGFKQLTRRLFNLIFLKDQLQEMICDFIDPQIYKKLDNSIFNVDKLRKMISQSPQYRDILTNINDIVEEVLMNEQRLANKIANITVFNLLAKLFDNLYYQQEKNALQTFFTNQSDYKLSEHTFIKYQQIMEDWFMVIGKNIPDYFIKTYSIYFCKSFYQCVQCQILNSNKFKFPFKLNSVIHYLDSDVSFIINKMKQRFFDENIVNKEIQKPVKKLLDEMQTETLKLASIFESATLKNDKMKCRYVLVMLNLRAKDQKAMEFVKKYKSITQN